MGKADPMLSLTVEGQTLPFWVDTGATYSTVNRLPSAGTLSHKTVVVVGFSGVPQTLPVSQPLSTEIGQQTTSHAYVVSSQVPVNLMGRDLLNKLAASILCGPDGLTVTFSDGKKIDSGVATHGGQWLLSNPTMQMADIYWGKLTTTAGILAGYARWKPWIMALDLYSPPVDAFHATYLL